MSQSSFIVAVLLTAFVLFLAAKNRLQDYAAVLWGPTAKPVGGGGPITLQSVFNGVKQGMGPGGTPPLVSGDQVGPWFSPGTQVTNPAIIPGGGGF